MKKSNKYIPHRRILMHKMGVREIRFYATGHVLSFGFDAIGDPTDQRIEYMYMRDKNLETFYRTYHWQDTMFNHKLIKKRHTPQSYNVNQFEYDLQCKKCGCPSTVVIGHNFSAYEHYRCFTCQPLTTDELQ